jgi:hypothetical protein
MITASIGANKTINNLKGLVCIDCWEEKDLLSYYQLLEQRIDFEQFDSIIVANYELLLDSSTDLSQHNVLETYSWSTYTPEMLLPIMKEARSRKTSNWLKTKFTTNSFLILTPESMKYHVSTTVPHITDWLVIGGSWGMCTHARPLGFNSLKTLPYNFYITDWSMYFDGKTFTKKDIQTDRLTWIDQGNSLYKLHS